MTKFGTFLAVFAFLNGLTACVSPEQRVQADATGAALLRDEKAKGGQGLIVADLAVDSPVGRGAFCSQSTLIATRVEGGRSYESIELPGSNSALVITFVPRPRAMNPGTYHIARVTCRRLRGTTTLRGDYATFEVRSGEFANIGQLRIIVEDQNMFTGTPAVAQSSVGPIPEPLVAAMRQAAPQLTATMVDRPMKITGSGANTLRRS